MAHFAELDVNNKVINIHVISNNELTDENGDEQEQLGIEFLTNLNAGVGWFVQTSYNNNFRKQYAGIGFLYDRANDVFISLQPFPSWTLDSSSDWQPPTAMPDDDKEYEWNEDTQAWDEKE